MENNIKFLNYIVKNTEMGFSSINDLIDLIKVGELKKIIQNQKEKYKEIYREAKELLNEYNGKLEEKNNLEKINSYIMIKMSLIADKSTSHIAEMMIKGSNMGIIDIEKKLNSYKDIDKNVKKLGEKLLETEKNNLENLKPFLKEK